MLTRGQLLFFKKAQFVCFNARKKSSIIIQLLRATHEGLGEKPTWDIHSRPTVQVQIQHEHAAEQIHLPKS